MIEQQQLFEARRKAHEPTPPWPTDYSLFCFAPTNGVRIACVELVNDWRFNNTIVAAIAAKAAENQPGAAGPSADAEVTAERSIVRTSTCSPFAELMLSGRFPSSNSSGAAARGILWWCTKFTVEKQTVTVNRPA